MDDYSRFTWVKFLASKDEAPGFIIKFLKMIQVRLNAAVRNIHTDNETEFVNQTLQDYYEQVVISHETSVAQTPQQNGVVERQNRTLVESAQTMLIYAKPPLFLWTEAVATASKADIGIFIGYAPKKKAYRIHNRRTQEIIETIHVDFDELTAMASEQSSLEPALHEITLATLGLGLVPNPPPSEPFVPPSRHEWDLVFQPVFDEFFSPPASVASPFPVEEAPAPVESTGSPSSTTIDQDAPSPSTSQTTPRSQSQTIPLCAEEESHDLEVAHMIEPKTYKDALTQSCWIEAMQEELHEFERLEVWELVPRPDKVMEERIDFEESFAPVAKLEVVRNVLKTGSLIDLSPRDIFLNQSKYALESLKKYGMESCDPMDTPMVEKSKLDEDTQGKAIDHTHYRGMVDTLMYLTSSRPDMVYAVCMCARYQAYPTEKHLHAVKRIFRYLRGHVNRGLWYSKDSAIALTVFANADHAGCQDTRRSTSGSMQLLGDRLVSWSSKGRKALQNPV
ncbi:retrovirus-related pol polyprotein from transposon TNT 1-94 [Tanacetum coccineum]